MNHSVESFSRFASMSACNNSLFSFVVVVVVVVVVVAVVVVEGFTLPSRTNNTD